MKSPTKCSSFKARIEIRGINPFVLIRKSRAHALKPGWKKPMPALIQINGKPNRPHRTNLMPVGDGNFYLYLNGSIRAEAGVVCGDVVQVAMEFDVEYQNGPQHPLPPSFENGLKTAPPALKNWNALSPSRKKEVLRYFAQIKSQDALSRNIARALSVLSGNEGRFLARTWTNGS